MQSIPALHQAGSGRRTHQMMWTFFLVALPFYFTAAAPHELPHEDQATLYFFNTSGWKAIPEKVTLLDNGRKTAALNREQYIVLSLAPGHHVLELKEERPPKGAPKHEVHLDAKPGATYYVAGGYVPDLHTLLWTFAEISKEEADRLLAKMKLQEKK
jgi:hypothetical protein